MVQRFSTFSLSRPLLRDRRSWAVMLNRKDDKRKFFCTGIAYAADRLRIRGDAIGEKDGRWIGGDNDDSQIDVPFHNGVAQVNDIPNHSSARGDLDFNAKTYLRAVDRQTFHPVNFSGSALFPSADSIKPCVKQLPDRSSAVVVSFF